MIPIVSIANLISALFFGSIALKLYPSRAKTEDDKLEDFFKVFLFLAILLFLISTPGLIFKDLAIIGLMYALYPFFALLALAYMGVIPLKIMGWRKVKQIFFKGLIIAASLITAINLLRLKPAVVYNPAPLIYWQDSRGILMNNVLGALLGATLLSIIMFFIIQGFKTKEQYLRTRAFLVATGLLGLMASSVINFIFGASSQVYINSLFATFFNILSAIFFLAGIYYKPKNNLQG